MNCDKTKWHNVCEIEALLLDEIERSKREDLAKIYVQLNRGRWPEEFRDNRQELDLWQHRCSCVGPMMLIKDMIGEKAISRYRMVTLEGMTDQQFDDWWDSIKHRPAQEPKKEFSRWHLISMLVLQAITIMVLAVLITRL